MLLFLYSEADSRVVNVMKQSGCNIPGWMDQLPKLTKRDKRRIKQKMVKRKDIDAESKLERRIKREKSKITT
jgi:ATP-dependent RNA helicase DDX52/ROK1